MTQRRRIRDLVIFVPGLMGSRLRQRGETLWGDEDRTFLGWLRNRGDRLGRLSVGTDDPSAEELGDGIAADGVLETPFVVGRVLTAGGYGPLLATLRERAGLRPGENLQVFAYDWRRDVATSARRLALRADGWLRAWQAKSRDRQARLVLVAHGLGGLVARYFVDALEGWRSTRRLVTLGTPFLGSVRALDFLYFGTDLERYGVPLHDVTPIVRTFTSVYQLLPRFGSIHTFAGEVVTPFEIRIPTFEQEKMERSRQFHRTLLDHHLRSRSAPGYEELRATAIAGVGQPTIERARLLPNATLSVDADPHELETDGDGAVPRFSADGTSPGVPGAHALYVPQSHGLLASDPVILSHLAELVAEPGPGSALPASPLPRITLRRTLADQLRVEADSVAVSADRPFYRIGHAVELLALARTAGGYPVDPRSCRVEVRVEHVVPLGRRVRATRIRMMPEPGRPGWFVGRFRPAAPGTYRAIALARSQLLSPFSPGIFFEVY